MSRTLTFLNVKGRVQGNYMQLAVSSEDGTDVSFEIVKHLLEKAGARRKTT